MTIDANDLREFIGSTEDDDVAFIERCYNEAVALINLALASAFRPVPEVIEERLVLEVGNELYKRKNASGANSQFAAYDGGATPVRSPRDPLAQVRPIIGMYVTRF